MATLSEPQYFPYRLLIFGEDGTMCLKAFSEKVLRDRAARELDDKTLALAVTVDYLCNGGDEPKRPIREPKRPIRTTPRKVVQSKRR